MSHDVLVFDEMFIKINDSEVLQSHVFHNINKVEYEVFLNDGDVTFDVVDDGIPNVVQKNVSI